MIDNIYVNGGFAKRLNDRLGFPISEANASENNRIQTATAIAAISRGKDASNNPELRYKKLLKESADNATVWDLIDPYFTPDRLAGRPLEFIPVIIPFVIKQATYDNQHNCILKGKDNDIVLTLDNLTNNIFPFSYIEYIAVSESAIGILYTNMRALLNAGIKYENIPYNGNVENFEAVHVEAPYFTFAQIRTHSKISQVAVSDRVIKKHTYWLPDDIVERLEEFKHNDTVNVHIDDYLRDGIIELETFNNFLHNLSLNRGKQVFKDLGYKDEIVNRFPSFMSYKQWIMAGYVNDPKAWGHLLLEREAKPELHKSWVQKETRMLASALAKLIIND